MFLDTKKLRVQCKNKSLDKTDYWSVVSDLLIELLHLASDYYFLNSKKKYQHMKMLNNFGGFRGQNKPTYQSSKTTYQ